MKYRITYLPPAAALGPLYDYAMVIYHNRFDGPTPSSCNMLILNFGSWDTNLG